MAKIRIVSEGLASNTIVYCGDEEIDGIKSIHIDPILPGQPITATVRLYCDKVDVFCQTNGNK